MIEHITRQRQPTAPMIRPVGIAKRFVCFRKTPQSALWASLVNQDLRHGWRWRQRKICNNEVRNVYGLSPGGLIVFAVALRFLQC